MTTAIRKHLRDFVAILLLAVIAAGVAGYILSNQRLRFPVIQDKPFELKAEFETAQAVIAGQGQTVRVAGVRIGDISGVELEGGKAIVSMDIDKKYGDLVHTNATALLRPKTGLKDMFVDLDPGESPAPLAKENWKIPIRNTLPDINPDEVLSVLDGDTRDYLRLLIGGAGKGLKGRGPDLQDIFRRFEPTHRDLARVTTAVATRRQNLRRLIHSLNLLNRELASKDDELSQLVDSSAAVFRAFASENQNISRAVRTFPGALRQTTDTLGKVQRFAQVLGPAAEELRPAVRKLDAANRAVRPFVREAAPIIKNRIRPFVRDTRPLVRQLRPAARRLSTATPDLTRSFVVLNHLFNLISYNQNGREGPETPMTRRDEGYLFWIAWLSHQSLNLFNSSDAHGVFRPTTAGGACGALEASLTERPELEFLTGLTAVLNDPAICGG